MLLKLLICVVLCLTVKAIYNDDNDNNKEAMNNRIDCKILQSNDIKRPTLIQKLFLLPYKPFKKPIKGNTKPMISSITSKPSPTSLENKKQQVNVTATTIPHIHLNEKNTTNSLNFNEGMTTENPKEINSQTVATEASKPIVTASLENKEEKFNVTVTTISSVIHNEENTANTLPLNINEGMTIEITEEINCQTVAIETSTTVVIEADTERTTLFDKGTTGDLSTDIITTFDIDIKNQTTLTTKDDYLTTELPTSINMEENFENYEELAEICVRYNEYHLIKGECDTFIECKKGVAFIHKCSEGLLFNPKALWPNYPCSYPSEVKCEGKITQAPQATKECEHQYGFFPSKLNCSQYIMCQEGKAYPLSCPAGLVFNTEINSCDWPANVPSCQSTVLNNYNCPESTLNTGADLKYRYGNSCREYVLCLEGHPRLLKCDLGFAFDEKQGFCVNSEYVQNCVWKAK